MALRNGTTGNFNTAIGAESLVHATGQSNTASGSEALYSNTTGSDNVGLGRSAGFNGTTGSNNIYVGANVQGVAGESNTMYLGKVGTQTKTLIAGIRGTVVTGGEMVVIDADGRLGSTAAALTPGANSVGTNEVINDSLTSDDLAPNSVGASEVAFNYAGSASEGGAASNADLLDGIDSTAFASSVHGHNVSQVTNAATLGANTFSATQTIDTGNIDLDNSTTTTGNITKNGARFLHNFGTDNTFLGQNAGNFSMTGNFNTATGLNALSNNTTGQWNVAAGHNALLTNTTGDANTAVGRSALRFNTTGWQNTAIGHAAMLDSATGTNNTAVGNAALQNVKGNNNVAVGSGAGFSTTNGSNNIYLGFVTGAVVDESNTIYVGTQGTQTKTLIAGIRGTTTGNPNAIPVMIDSAGQLGTASSSRRFKEDIHEMPASLTDRLLKLRPVTFRYTKAYADGSKPVQFGLVAEEVADVFPELAVRSADGTIETVHYETLNVLLLNQLQQQEKRIQALEQKLNDLLAKVEDAR